MTVSTIIIAILLFGLLIVAHELGHFMLAKATGIRVEEFSIGMGPAIFQRQGGETVYSLRILPIGGFNRMTGEEPGKDVDDPRSFSRKTVGQRVAVISAGSLMNFVLAIILYGIIFLVVGVPQDIPVVGKIMAGWPAEDAGIRAGDTIVAIDGEQVASWSQVVEIIHQHPDQEVVMNLQRDGQQLTVTVVPRSDPQSGLGMIGIEQTLQRYSPGRALVMSISQVGQFIWLLLVALVQIIAGQAPADLVGPVGIVQLVGQAAQFGVASLLSFAAFISLNLGLINLLPIPALDGSRLVFLAAEGIRGKPLDPQKEGLVHFIGFVMLMVFMLVITYRDIANLVGG